MAFGLQKGSATIAKIHLWEKRDGLIPENKLCRLNKTECVLVCVYKQGVRRWHGMYSMEEDDGSLVDKNDILLEKHSDVLIILHCK